MSFRIHVERAIDLCGSQATLAQRIGISQQGVSWLLKEAPQISAEHAVAIEKATEGKVTRVDLRPDLFGAATPAPARSEEAA